MIFSLTCYFTLTIYQNLSMISFPQCNVYIGVQSGRLALRPLDGYLNMPELMINYRIIVFVDTYM